MPAGEVRLPEAAGGVRHVQGRLLASLHRLQEGQRRGEWSDSGEERYRDLERLDIRLQVTTKSLALWLGYKA